MLRKVTLLGHPTLYEVDNFSDLKLKMNQINLHAPVKIPYIFYYKK